MSNFIHKTAVIDDTAIIGINASIGPYSIIHPNVINNRFNIIHGTILF